MSASPRSRRADDLAHHPAQCFDQIGFTAAVRPDDPGHAGLDIEIDGIDEGFEADEAETGELHGMPVRTLLFQAIRYFFNSEVDLFLERLS